MSSEGNRLEFLEERVLALEESVAELAKWTKFNHQEKNTGNNVANVHLGKSAEAHLNVQNNGNPEEEIDIVCKVEVMDANDDQQTNQDSIDPQETSSDKIWLEDPLLETSSFELEYEDTEKWMPSGSSRFVVNQRSKDEGTITYRNSDEIQIRLRKIKSKRDSSEECNSSICSESENVPSSSKKKIGVKPKVQWKCPHCPRILRWESELTNHILVHTGERPFSCPHCPKATTRKEHLKLHIQKIHPKENQNFHSCGICQKKFPSRKTRTVHMKIHLHCYFCSLRVKKYYELQQHIRIHTEEKPFKCPHCLYSTHSERNLRDHIRIKHRNATN